MTNTSFKLIFAALAATAALTACTKEPTPPNFENDKVNPAAEGSRVIAVSFGPQTKTSFTSTEDGIQPKFDNKDSILLVTVPDDPMAEVDTQTVAVSVDPETGKATITTTLHGTLRALYPAKSAIFAKENFNIYVPAEQSGKFEDANICQVRQIEENADNVQFENMYSLFIITPPEGTKKLIVRSLREIGEDGQRSEKRYPLNGEDKDTITVGDGTAAVPSPCYIALLCTGINLSDLSFEASPDAVGTAGYIKGIPTSAIADAAGGAVGSEQYEGLNYIRSNVADTSDENNWHGYVTFAGHKWATMNIGANSPEEYGDYFAWGETVGHPLKSDWKDTFDDDKYVNAFVGNYSFEWVNCPFTNGIYSDGNKSVFTKYVPESKAGEYGYEGYHDVKTVLDLCDDAANVIWGGPWRMPTKAEAQDFLNNTDKWNDCLGADGCIYFQNIIKVPCSGQVFGPDLWYPINDRLQLWSSTLKESDPKWATILYFDTSTPSFSVGNDLRNNGLPIRAIVDDPDYIATEE